MAKTTRKKPSAKKSSTTTTKRKRATNRKKTASTKPGSGEPTSKTAQSKSTRPKTTQRKSTRPKTTRKRVRSATADNPWSALGLEESIVAALAANGFETPTDIQRELIPPALAGSDCLGQARTGTGKTAAFALPMIQQLEPKGGMQALVLAPTRELAAQVDEHVRDLHGDKPLRTVVVLGGRRLRDQVEKLRKKPEIAIGTPGRVLDLMNRKELRFDDLRLVVLDEVDRMLDIGFRDDIRRILGAIKKKHQTIFVSATLNNEIQRLAKQFMHEPVEVDVSRDVLTVDSVEHGFVTVHPRDKFPSLVQLLKHEDPKLAIVFTNTKIKARRVAKGLRDRGVNCKEIHGDLLQERRERVMRNFRQQNIHILVATDLAARGLDVTDISHIINYDIPEDPAVYVHRIGRTARMGKAGRAITFVTRDEGKALTEVEMLINRELPKYDPPWLIKRELTPEELAAEEARHAPTEPAGPPERYVAPRQRDNTLDSMGLKPVRKTLGSRFRKTRRRR